ncbi:MAG: polysaccharide deacetylase family protein [Colwellia sp.]|nr:polysaccharide deacetylase family protein [Colwellia sp.]
MFNWLLRQYANYHCSKNGKNRLNILTYHRVSQTFNPFKPKELSWDMFKEQLVWLKRHFIVLSLPIALDLIEKNQLPPRAVCLTIDDGYSDCYHLIFKTLQEQNIKASFFICTDGIVNGFLWDEEIANVFLQMSTTRTELSILGVTFDVSTYAKRQKSMLSLIELLKYKTLIERELVINELCQITQTTKAPYSFLTKANILEMHQAGMTIGAHTHKHPILCCETYDVAYNQIHKSKLILEDIISEKVDYFAYPNGKYQKDFNIEHMDMLKNMGFKAALSTNWGSLKDLSKERYTIKRFTPWDGTEKRFCFRLASNFSK